MSASTMAPSRPSGDRSSQSWRHWKSQSPLIAGSVLLAAVAAGFVWLFVSNQHFSEAVNHTLQMRSKGYRLLTIVQDAETGQRGYLLSGDRYYLEPYLSAVVAIPQAVADLQALAGRDQIQSATLARMKVLIEAKQAELAKTIALTDKGDTAGALAIVKNNKGNHYMSAIREEIGHFEDQEERAQNAQNAAARFNDGLLEAASLSAILLVILLGAYSIVATRRATTALIKAQDDLRHTNENLEGLVAERVADLQMANEEIQRFAYIVSHDLRAPLVNVMGFTSELETARAEISGFLQDVDKTSPELVTADRRLAIETDLPEALGFIRTSTAKMDRLINAILKLSREGRRVLTPQKIDVRDLIEAQGESLSQQMQAGQAELLVQQNIPDLVSDRLAMEQIFGNLIENAIKYLSPQRPGRISVNGETRGAYVYYNIVDNGRGIDKKDFERIFELFRRSGEQDKPGEGIGLAYVRNLARRLGGNVAVKSEFGTGSTFTVTLPAVLNAKARSS